MKWSFRLGRFAGIDVYMHVTFLLLISWVALLHWRQGQSVAAAVAGIIFILVVFLCVVLHEFGHALPVTFNRKLVGLLTMDNLGEYMRIQAALKS